MWRVANHTPYAAGRIWGRNKEGLHEWIIAVKATYDIQPDGNLLLAVEQLEPLLLPEYNGEDGNSSLRYEADLVGPKPTTDVLLNGTAYAPNGKPSKEFMVSLKVGPIEKKLRVVGDRVWDGLRPSSAVPVDRLPIVYERAYGGFDQSDPDPKNQRMDARNPVGCGLVTQKGLPMPNFEYPSGSLEKAGPAGFGPVASYWSPRRELQGTYDDAWKKSRFPLLPADWDLRSLLCSPSDQQPQNHLRGGEIVELENLTPSGKLSFKLPKSYLRFKTRIANRVEEHQDQLTSVIIEPDFPRVIMVWQSILTVRNDGDYLDETVITEKTRLR